MSTPTPLWQLPREDAFGILVRIERSDPNARETGPPTPGQLEAHRQWAIETFGAEAWQTYVTPYWGGLWPAPEV